MSPARHHVLLIHRLCSGTLRRPPTTKSDVSRPRNVTSRCLNAATDWSSNKLFYIMTDRENFGVNMAERTQMENLRDSTVFPILQTNGFSAVPSSDSSSVVTSCTGVAKNPRMYRNQPIRTEEESSSPQRGRRHTATQCSGGITAEQHRHGEPTP